MMVSPQVFWLPLLQLGLALALLFALMVPGSASTALALSKENKLKAAYLLNFTKFIEWPIKDPSIERQRLYICLQDLTPFDVFLKQLISSRSAIPGKRSIKVVPLYEAEACDLTYLHSTTSVISPVVLASVTVADSQEVDHLQAAITFYLDQRKLRFEVDMATLKTLNVNVSSELLKLARLKTRLDGTVARTGKSN
jgi:hypothetical protein